jgi:UDP-N-acetylglucosamine 2-epimerase (non-hydrolysing)
MKRLKIVNVVGARPNFMKVAPIYEMMTRQPQMDPYIVHTGQHYDPAMSEFFFEHLGLPKPHRYLGVGSGSHGEQTGRIMIEFERVLDELGPDLVVVVGDVNSTIACGLVAAKSGVKLAHVEAGLRSFDRSMPEEVNRVLTDQIADYLFTTEASAWENLRREGIGEDKIFFVGNVMIDTLLAHRAKAAERDTLTRLDLSVRGYVLVTLHRPANVDDPEVFSRLMDVLGALSEELPVVFPMHPRTRRQMQVLGLTPSRSKYPNLKLIEPLGYLDFLRCLDGAIFVITDSGGIQEETTVLDVPCLTARDNTERPVTVTEGTNLVTGRDPGRILDEAHKILKGDVKGGRRPERWDGHAAERIVKILAEREGLTGSVSVG